MKSQRFLGNQVSVFSLIIASILLLILSTGCVSQTGLAQQSDWAVKTSSQRSEENQMITTPINFTLDAVSTPAPVQAELPFAAGSLLKSPDDPGVFRLTPGGTRQHIYDWPTYLNLGFEPNDIVIIQKELLDSIPMQGELTRLVYDSNHQHFWAVNGHLWPVQEWATTITGDDYQGIAATPIDDLFLNTIPIADAIPNNILMRDGQYLYLKQNDHIYPLKDAVVYQAYGYGDDEIIDVPLDVLAKNHLNNPLTTLIQDEAVGFNEADIYQIIAGRRQLLSKNQVAEAGYTKSHISRVPLDFLESFPLATSLQVFDTGANLRQGPGTEYEVIGQAYGKMILTPVARNEDSSWFQVLDQGRLYWIAASVTHFSGNLDLLAVETVPPAKVAAGPTPTEAKIHKPISCEEVPIRGFGKVWADHPEIQPTLGCPYTWQAGEHATQAAIQYFENGTMLWLEQDRVRGQDPVYVLFEDDYTFQRFRDMGPADPTRVGATDEGFHPIGDKFSKVYWEGTGAQVKERLGRAITPATDSPSAFQGFNNGRMFWLGSVDRIFVIYDFYRYDDKGQSTRIKVWGEYEDTF